MVWIKPHQKYHYVCTIWIIFDALLNKMNHVEGFSAKATKMLLFCSIKCVRTIKKISKKKHDFQKNVTKLRLNFWFSRKAPKIKQIESRIFLDNFK